MIVGTFLQMRVAKLCMVAMSLVAVQNALAQSKPTPVSNAIQEPRTQRLMPLSTAPSFDWQRIQNAYAFVDAHSKSIENTFLTTAQISGFASKDIEPVIVYTGDLLTKYNQQATKTVNWMNEILTAPKEKQDFIKKNYKRAVDFGLMNLDLSQAVKLKWNPKVRVPGNQQAFAFTMYSYAWLPIEQMIATNEIDSAKDAKAIDDWLYLWHVLGYGMGLDSRLLPKDFHQTAEIVRLLRAYQYPSPGEEIPHPVRALMRNEMSFLYFLHDDGQPIDDPTKLEIRKNLALQISYSPNLSQALGLGPDPAKGLENLDRTID